MAEPMKSDDGEDVLANIRRLVAADPQSSVARERLVLTSEFRIDPEGAEVSAADRWSDDGGAPRAEPSVGRSPGDGAQRRDPATDAADPAEERLDAIEAAVTEPAVDQAAPDSAPQSTGLRYIHQATGARSAATQSGGDEPLTLGAEEEAALDEDMLRDLVAEIVREELSGALGERITRNVRKLVRREIMRALSARDME